MSLHNFADAFPPRSFIQDAKSIFSDVYSCWLTSSVLLQDLQSAAAEAKQTWVSFASA